MEGKDRTTSCPDLTDYYGELWAHARHQEQQRLQFTNIYAIIVAGILTGYAIFSDIEAGIRVLIFFFLSILSLFGLYIIDAWNKSFAFYRELIRGITSACGLPAEPDYHTSRFPVWKSFLLFYSFMCGLFIGVLYLEITRLFSLQRYVFNVFNINIFISIIIMAILTIILYRDTINRSNEFWAKITRDIRSYLNEYLEGGGDEPGNPGK